MKIIGTRDINRAIVIGAGASCSYSESPTGMRPPLAREIIQTYNKLSISENRYVLVGFLVNYVRDKRGVQPSEFGSWDEDLETFFSELDEEVAIYSQKLMERGSLTEKEYYHFIVSLNAYNQMVFLLASVFNEIQNGPVSKPYMVLASEFKNDDAIITFNWDTLLDRALFTSGIWSPRNGYYIKPEAIYDDQWHDPNTINEVINGPLYLKVHGSTNWLAPYHSINLTTGEKHSMSNYAIDKLFLFFKATKPYVTYEDRYWGSYEPFSYCYYPPNLPIDRDNIENGHTAIRIVSACDLPEHGRTVVGGKEVYSIPMIVPPVRNKQYERYGIIFISLWEKSREVLSQCKQLFIIGYSFPKTDIETKKVFSECLYKNNNLEKVVIIDPYPEDIQKLFINEFKIESSKLEVRKGKFEALFSSNRPIL